MRMNAIERANEESGNKSGPEQWLLKHFLGKSLTIFPSID